MGGKPLPKQHALHKKITANISEQSKASLPFFKDTVPWGKIGGGRGFQTPPPVPFSGKLVAYRTARQPFREPQPFDCIESPGQSGHLLPVVPTSLNWLIMQDFIKFCPHKSKTELAISINNWFRNQRNRD